MFIRAALNVLFIAVALISTQAWCFSKTQHMTVHATSSTLVFSLPANPTTGYQWILKTYDQSVLSFQKKAYKVSSQRIGAPGNMTWVFKLSHQNPAMTHTEIILEYKRPWQADIIKVMKVVVILGSNSQRL